MPEFQLNRPNKIMVVVLSLISLSFRAEVNFGLRLGLLNVYEFWIHSWCRRRRCCCSLHWILMHTGAIIHMSVRFMYISTVCRKYYCMWAHTHVAMVCIVLCIQLHFGATHVFCYFYHMLSGSRMSGFSCYLLLLFWPFHCVSVFGFECVNFVFPYCLFVAFN